MKKRKGMAALLMALSLGLTGCGLLDAVDNEIRPDYELKEDAVIYPAAAGEVAKSDETEELLEGYELALENDYLELYIGQNYDIAVYEKFSGVLTFSNAAYHDMEESERNNLTTEAKRQMLSQVSVEYYNSSQKKNTMYSYPDAYSEDKNQVSWEVAGDTLTVTYGLGTNMEESPLIQVFTKETFEAYLEQLDAMVENGEINLITYRDFAGNYTAYTYENMSSDDQKRYLEMYPKLEELGTLYIVKNRLSNRNTNAILAVYSLLGIDESVRESENEKLGENTGNIAPAFFRIPVRYRLSGADLLVSVDLRSIVSSEGYDLTKVELLKCFGASKDTDPGYVFYPDGSGAVAMNNLVSNSMDKLVVPFYGEDQSVTLLEGTSIAVKNTFPVFGIKAGDHAVFAIVENGAAIGGMSAQVHGSNLKYNTACPYFIYHVVDNFGIQGVDLAFYEVAADVDYTVRYHFLNGEDADYSGMAAYYRQYLEQTGTLTRHEGENSDWGLDVELLGSMWKTINDFGIPINKNYAVTSFDQAREIIDILHGAGITDVDVVYSGVVNGGMEQKALSRIRVQKELGGLKGYQALDDYLTSQNDALFMGMDPIGIYGKGNGIRKTEDVSKYLSKSSVLVGATEVGEMNNFSSSDWLINPLRYDAVTTKFLKAFQKVGTDKLYLESVGAYLNGNYSLKQGVTRQTVQILTEQMLQRLVDAGYRLKLDVGNDYVLKYADSLINVPCTSSHQRIESFSIPFVGMVLKGYIPFTCNSINQSPNIQTALLQAIESGAGLNYLLIYDNQLNLINTNYEDLFSVNYETQIDEILENYKRLNDQMGYLQNIGIARHDHLTDDVNCITYEDGTKVYVNYGKEEYQASEGVVEAFSWMVVGR